MSSLGPNSIQLNSLIAPENKGLPGLNKEPAPKRARLAQKTQDEVLAENNERAQSQRLPPVGKNATSDDFIEWIFKHYTKEPLADYEDQLVHWNEQTVQPYKRTFNLANGKETPTYNSLQSGSVRATALSPEEQELAKIERIRKLRITMAGRRLGQLNWLECAGFKAFVKFMQALGYDIVRFERMPDCVIVDFCAIIASESRSVSAPVQVKVARGQPGMSVNFHVNKADGADDGRYEDHILICLVVDLSDNANMDCNEFDELPGVNILEAYIMKSSDIKSSFQPYVYDHRAGSKRGRRKNAYEAFRYVVGRDGPDKLDKLMRSLESNIHEIWKKCQWTRDDCFFTFGAGSPNTKVAANQETELRGMKAVSDALKPFEARSPLRHAETVDIIFWNPNPESGHSISSSVRISLKTATYNAAYKNTGDYSGFQFMLSKAPNAHYCDIVVAVQFSLADKTKVVAAYVFDATEVYKTDRKTFCWHKSAHHNKKFNMTNDVGRQGFKDHIAFFMKTDEKREEHRITKVLQRFRVLFEGIQKQKDVELYKDVKM